MTAVAEPVRGRVISNRYQLREQLGRGGMGSVWRATDLKLHIEVAVKLIDPIAADYPEARARFEREALAAAQLRSMHIVLITDHGVDADIPFIVMEFLRGESLAKRLQRERRFSFDQALEWFTQIADALGVAHERRIVHRDLKPDNVFIVSERGKEYVKVLDFGVAKRLDAQSFGNDIKTHTGTLLGTPYYMSPEQSRGAATIDHRADLWSFGVMTYECLTGKRPFDADTLPDLLIAICRDPCTPPSLVAPVPRGFDDWFARATAREPSDRFDNVEEALSCLCALRGEPLVGGAARQDINEPTRTPSADGRLSSQLPTDIPRQTPGAAESSVSSAKTATPKLGEGTTSSAVANSFVPSSLSHRPRRASSLRLQLPRTVRWSGLALIVVGSGYGLWVASGSTIKTTSPSSAPEEALSPGAIQRITASPSGSPRELPQDRTASDPLRIRPAATDARVDAIPTTAAASATKPVAPARRSTQSGVAPASSALVQTSAKLRPSTSTRTLSPAPSTTLGSPRAASAQKTSPPQKNPLGF